MKQKHLESDPHVQAWTIEGGDHHTDAARRHALHLCISERRPLRAGPEIDKGIVQDRQKH